MIRNGKDITALYNQRHEELRPLHERLNNDYGLWRLTPFELKGDYQNVTSNDPRVLADKIVDSLAYCPCNFEIASGGSRTPARRRRSAAERLIYGCLNLANSRNSMLTQPPIQALLAWFATVQGCYATRVWMHKEKSGGETIPLIDVWDLLNTVWQTGRDGLSYVIHKRSINKEEAEGYGVKDVKGKFTYLYDYYSEGDNVLVIQDEEVETNVLPFGHIPVMVSMVGATPFIDSDKYDDTIKDRGESIFAPNRGLYAPKSRLLTLYLTIVSTGAHNPLAIYSKGGKKAFKKSPYHPGGEVHLDVDKGEKVEELYKPEMPRDTQYLLNEYMREISMGGLSPIAHGQVDTALPGYGIHLLTHNTASVLEPRKFSMQDTLSWIARELLSQFGQGGLAKIKVNGRDSTNEQFIADISSSDIKGDWFPEAKLEPELPDNKAENMATAQIAVLNKLMSIGTAREKILHIKDSDAEDDRVLAEDMNQISGVKIAKMQELAKEEGHPEVAAILPMLAGMMSPQPAGRTSYEGVKEPAYATGMRPEILPREQLGSENANLPREQAEDARLGMMGLARGR